MGPMAAAAERLDPTLGFLAGVRTDLSPGGLDAVRRSLNERRRDSARTVDLGGVDVAELEVPGTPRVPVRVYRAGPVPAPTVIYCHSGAFVLGNLDTDHRQCVELARRGQCTVVSVDYRLAPEHPHPSALDDVQAVLRWAAGSPGEIDGGRLAVAGSSAGGALAALVAQRSAAGQLPPVAVQILHQPVLDDRPTASTREFTAAPAFDGAAVAQMWRHLGGAATPRDAVPARCADLAGLAPALITCSELDPLRDEAIDYARRLLAAGVATDLRVFARTCHGFDALAPEWHLSAELFAIQGAALRRAFTAS
ncbi:MULTISPECIES: alpha/beta hydrolase [Mycobacteriaceae]|uniref:alpha/beta hydrolase n=1 Tax=Mycobacteriaceae TaxID=1762 RepID=UPI0007FC0B76|nr:MULTISPECIES: alpha/beta hydrolase [Mycobacteriaceae]MCK0177403.1 alpha/beta hydrolase [Mycolicibacterium sp. F2034L]OBB58393.1 alpha/beta hydrolase [Mycobacterium sp. 852013-51886_SCH5428379]